MISVDTMLHEFGYTFNGVSRVGDLLMHEIIMLKNDRAKMNMSSKDLDNDWKEEQLNKLSDLDYEKVKNGE